MGISYTSIINKEMRQASGQCYHIKPCIKLSTHYLQKWLSVYWYRRKNQCVGHTNIKKGNKTMIPRYKHRFFMIREYAFYCIPNKFNEYDAKYKLYYSHDNKNEFIGYADTVAEAKKRARWFLNYYFM